MGWVAFIEVFEIAVQQSRYNQYSSQAHALSRRSGHIPLGRAGVVDARLSRRPLNITVAKFDQCKIPNSEPHIGIGRDA